MAKLLRSAMIAAITLSQAQITPLEPQTDVWNSSFSFDQSQLLGANLSDVQVANIEQALNFERSNWATGSRSLDSLYYAPSNSSSLPPGSVIKVEAFVNTSNYTLPPNIALSRILYTTRDLLNQTIPASAVILWPYVPTQYPNLTDPDQSINSLRLPLVAWAHGTSGIFAECGPSHIRNLWYQYSAIYELALSGYVVVAPDYQGLGVNTTANGSPIVHPYLAASAGADDIFFAIQAAQEAFADIVSKEFVIMGHSQGGAAAWGSAIRQAQQPVDGYLGAISGSPPTNISGLIAILSNQVPPTLAFLWGEAVKALYPTFNESTILTDEGVARLRLAREQSMCNSAVGELLSDFPASDNGTLIHTNWTANPEIQSYLSTNDIEPLPIAGPMLVLQGTADPAVPYLFTDAAVLQTCAANDGNGIRYARFDQVSHVPVLYAARTIWLDFLRERFSTAGPPDESADNTCVTTNYTSLAMPKENYQKELNYFLSLATMPYQVA